MGTMRAYVGLCRPLRPAAYVCDVSAFYDPFIRSIFKITLSSLANLVRARCVIHLTATGPDLPRVLFWDGEHSIGITL